MIQFDDERAYFSFMGLVNQAPTRMLPWEVAEQLKGCKRCMDEHKCIFDAPEHLVQKILQVRSGLEGGGSLLGDCFIGSPRENLSSP